MNPKEIIECLRQKEKPNIPRDIFNRLKFIPGKNLENGEVQDLNRAFRQTLIEELAKGLRSNDLEFIRVLTQEELRATQHDIQHQGLSQLCAYLFLLGQKEDVFLLYDAKYDCGCMDAGCMIDTYMFTLRTPEDEMMAYLSEAYAIDKDLKFNYPELQKILKQIYTKPDYESDDQYIQFIQSYYGIQIG